MRIWFSESPYHFLFQHWKQRFARQWWVDRFYHVHLILNLGLCNVLDLIQKRCFRVRTNVASIGLIEAASSFSGLPWPLKRDFPWSSKNKCGCSNEPQTSAAFTILLIPKRLFRIRCKTLHCLQSKFKLSLKLMLCFPVFYGLLFKKIENLKPIGSSRHQGIYSWAYSCLWSCWGHRRSVYDK